MREKDRRKFIRLQAYHLAKYKTLSGEGKEPSTLAATIRDIGAGGVCFRSDEYLPVGTLIELRINFPHVSTSVFALAKVVWIRQRKKTRRFEAGAQFVEIDETVRKAIEGEVKLVFNRVNKSSGLFKVELFKKEGERMAKLPKILVITALACIAIALLIKLTTIGKLLPGPLPLNWAKLADTMLLFAIAISVASKK